MALADAIAVGDENKTPYWLEIADLRIALSEIALTGPSGRKYVFITSLEDTYRGRVGGVTVEANVEIAARQIGRHGHGGPSHRLATDEEIKQFKRDQSSRRAELNRDAEANKSTTIIRVEGVANRDGSVDLRPIGERRQREHEHEHLRTDPNPGQESGDDSSGSQSTSEADKQQQPPATRGNRGTRS